MARSLPDYLPGQLVCLWTEQVHTKNTTCHTEDSYKCSMQPLIHTISLLRGKNSVSQASELLCIYVESRLTHDRMEKVTLFHYVKILVKLVCGTLTDLCSTQWESRCAPFSACHHLGKLVGTAPLLQLAGWRHLAAQWETAKGRCSMGELWP